MKRYGEINGVNWSFQGYTLQQLEESIGEDLGEATGDLAIGPVMVRDLVNRIKELEAQVATQNP